MKISDQITRLLPLGESVLRRLIDAPAGEIDTALTRLEYAGSIGRRPCPTTGKIVIVDRRSSRADVHERENTNIAIIANSRRRAAA